jgi:PST family polysaccharide transporter
MTDDPMPAHRSDALFAPIDPASLKRRSVRGAAVSLGGQGVRFAITMASQIVMARLLLPAEFGLLAMVAPVINLVQQFNDLGLSAATVQRPKIGRDDVSALFWINVAVSLAMFAVVALASPLVGWFYDEPRTVGITIVSGALLVMGGASSQQMALLNRAMRFTQLAIIDVSAIACSLAAGVAAALLGAGYWSLVVMQFAYMAPVGVLSWAFTGWVPSRPRRHEGIGAAVKFGGHLTGFNLVNFFARNLDNVLIGRTYGSATLGLYDRAYKLMTLPLGQIATPVSRIAWPLLSRLVDTPDKYRQAYLRMLQAIHIATIPGMVCAIAIPAQIVATLFGAKWADVAPILFWLSLASLPSFVNSSLGWLFQSQNRTAEFLKVGIVSSVLIVGSFLVGLPYGAVGVARAYAMVTLFVHGPYVWFNATRRGPVSLGDLLRAVLPFAISGLVSFGALRLAGLYLDFAGIPGLVEAAIISYGGALLAWACLPAGRNMLALRDMLRRQS